MDGEAPHSREGFFLIPETHPSLWPLIIVAANKAIFRDSLSRVSKVDLNPFLHFPWYNRIRQEWPAELQGHRRDLTTESSAPPDILVYRILVI